MSVAKRLRDLKPVIKDLNLITPNAAVNHNPGGAPENSAYIYGTEHGGFVEAELQNELGNKYGWGPSLFRTRRRYFLQINNGSPQGNGFPTISAEGALQAIAFDTSYGAYREYRSAAALNSDAGLILHDCMSRGLNPDIEIKFVVPENSARRTWIGLFESDPMGADTDSTIEYVGLRVSTSPANTNFVVMSSDGTTENAPVEVGAVDTGVHKIRFIFDTANGVVYYSFDDGETDGSFTSNIPAAGTALGVYCETRTLDGAAKNMRFLTLDMWADA